MKSTIACLSFLLGLFLLTSCKNAPERKLIEQKDPERLIEKATDTSDEKRQSLEETKKNADEHYDFSYVSGDGKIKIYADADITFPVSDKIPMYRVRPAAFTDDEALALSRALFDGKDAWYYEEEGRYGGFSSKELADRAVRDLKTQMEETENNSEIEEEVKQRELRVIQYQIDEIMKDYDSLPDTLKKIPADGKFRIGETGTVKGVEKYRFLSAQTDDGEYFRIDNMYDIGFSDSRAYYTKNQNDFCSDMKVYVDTEEYPCQCRYGETEAAAIADAFIKKAGIDAKRMKTGYYLTSDGTNEESVRCPGYVFYYSRLIDSVPAAVTTLNAIYHDDAAEPWLYEQIAVQIDDDGICGFTWSSPTELCGTVSDNVSVLPFSDAEAVFEEMAPLIFQGDLLELEETSLYDHVYEIRVSNAELDLLRVRDSGSLTGVYTPAWVFYGTQTTYMTDKNRTGETTSYTEAEPWIVFAVNAVDGSVIDLIAGY